MKGVYDGCVSNCGDMDLSYMMFISEDFFLKDDK